MRIVHTKYKKNFQTKENIRGKYYNKKKFHKKKWKFLVKKFDLKKKYKIILKPKSLKNFYKQQLLNKQKFQYFYGKITYSKLKTEYKNIKKNKIRNPINMLKIYLEKRLDVLLYRLGIFSSIFESKQYINHKKVKINNVIVNNSNYKLKSGDYIQLNKLKTKYIRKLPYTHYQKQLEIILFLRDPKIQEIVYPFNLDYSFLLNHLNSK